MLPLYLSLWMYVSLAAQRCCGNARRNDLLFPSPPSRSALIGPRDLPALADECAAWPDVELVAASDVRVFSSRVDAGGQCLSLHATWAFSRCSRPMLAGTHLYGRWARETFSASAETGLVVAWGFSIPPSPPVSMWWWDVFARSPRWGRSSRPVANSAGLRV